MRALFVILSLIFTFSGCASAPLPREERELKFVEQTSLKKQDAYNLALAYLAKNLGNSNFAIKMKDPSSGTIITQMAFDCNELKQFMDPNRHSVLFNLEFSAKDNRVRFIFEALESRTYNGFNNAFLGQSYFTSDSDIEAIRPCVSRIKNQILTEVSGHKDSNW